MGRSTFSERRRRLLRFQVAGYLDQKLESRSTVTPIAATAALAISAAPAVGGAAIMHATEGVICGTGPLP
jgi:hypothetical protein